MALRVQHRSASPHPIFLSHQSKTQMCSKPAVNICVHLPCPYLVRSYQLVIVHLDAVHGDDRSGLHDVLAPLPPLLATDLHDAEDRLDGASPTEHEEVCGVTRWRDRGRVRRGRGVSENATGMRETPLARL